MNACQTVSLGTKVKFLSGGTPSKGELRFWEGDIPWVSSAEMVQRHIRDTKYHISEDGAKAGSRLVPAKTVLVVVRGMSLANEFRVAISERTMTFNQDLKALIPDKDLDPTYLFYYLLSQNNAIRDSASEAAHGTKKIDMPVLEQWPLPLPSFAIQKKIAATLSAYDELIENNKRRIALLEKMAEEIYREWFVRMRFPGYEKVKKEKGVPDGWQYVELCRACSLIKRGITPKYSETSKKLIINQRCIRDGAVNMGEARTHNTKIPQEKMIQYGDVLINSTGVGTLGRVAVFDYEDGGVTCDTHITICRSNKDIANIYYLGQTIKSLQNHFENMAVGSTGQTELGRDIIGQTKVLLPPIEIQKRFEGIIEPMWKMKRYLARKIENLEKTRGTLLPRLISGKLSVENLEIQFPPGMMDM